MRKLLKKKLLGIPLVAIVAVVLAAGVALALYTLPIPSTVTVTSNETIGVYTDEGCTESVISIPWGEVMQGASPTQEVFVKNNGGVIVGVAVTSTLDAAIGTVSATAVTGLAPGTSTSCILTLDVLLTATEGPGSFDINFGSLAE